jgi:hypothetical protein
MLCIDTQQIDLLSEDRVFNEEPTHIKPSCTILTKNSTRWLDMRWFFVKDAIFREKINLLRVDTKHNIADGFTKALENEEPTHIKPSCTILTRALSHKKLGVDIVCQDNNTTRRDLPREDQFAACRYKA